MNFFLKKYNLFTIPFLIIITLTFCKSERKESSVESELINIEVDTTSVFLKYQSTVFSLPSPHQVSVILKMNEVSYNPKLINDEQNFSRYSTTMRKALNLGIYGTDLGYLNIYNRTEEAITYYLIVDKLAKELEISQAVDEATLRKIEANLSHNDSILSIISSTYKDIDQYLSANNREAVGILILAGGWLESLYLSTQTLLDNYSKNLVKHITKQKYPLEKLIRLMAPYYDQSKEFSELIDQFTDLAYEFDCIDIFYNYKEPKVYPDKKLTVINSQTELNLNNYNLAKISKKVEEIRNKITD